MNRNLYEIIFINWLVFVSLRYNMISRKYKVLFVFNFISKFYVCLTLFRLATRSKNTVNSVINQKYVDCLCKIYWKRNSLLINFIIPIIFASLLLVGAHVHDCSYGYNFMIRCMRFCLKQKVNKTFKSEKQSFW